MCGFIKHPCDADLYMWGSTFPQAGGAPPEGSPEAGTASGHTPSADHSVGEIQLPQDPHTSRMSVLSKE